MEEEETGGEVLEEGKECSPELPPIVENKQATWWGQDSLSSLNWDGLTPLREWRAHTFIFVF